MPIELRAPAASPSGDREETREVRPGEGPARVLIVRLSAIGDVVNTLPALSLLKRRRPDVYVGFVVEDRARDLIVNHPLVDRAYVFPRRRWRSLLASPGGWARLAREVRDYARDLRSGRWDAVLDEQGNLKGAVHALASRAPRRVGFARGFNYELNHWFSTEQVTPPASRPHRVDKFVSLLSAIGVAGDEREYVLPADQGARSRVAGFLDGAGIAAGRAAVLHPGTSDHGAEKRWPPERFAALARVVHERLGRPVLVTWGPGEEDLARRVVELSGGTARLGPKTASLLELVELLRAAAVFVSADTGPMHLAAAVGVRCVALFGPKDPRVYRPYGEGHVVIRHAGAGSAPAMHRIEVEEVFAAVAAELGPA